MQVAYQPGDDDDQSNEEMEEVVAANPGVVGMRLALARRYFEASLPPGEAIRSPADTEAYLQARLRHLGHELFCCLYLDNRHRVLRFAGVCLADMKVGEYLGRRPVQRSISSGPAM